MVGDSSQEAKERQMGVELNCASTSYIGDDFTFLDCPGSLEFVQETLDALIGVDAAVVVCEPDPNKVLALQPLLNFMEASGIPHLIFVNKIDRLSGSVDEVMSALQSVSQTPLVLRQYPIVDGETIAGYIDLPSGRAFHYQTDEASELITISEDLTERFKAARYDMLEKVSDFDESLMESLLEDKEPGNSQAYDVLKNSFQSGQIVPVLFGAGEQENGVRRLLKLLRHEVAEPKVTAKRLKIDQSAAVLAQALKTYHTPSFGKLSVVRVWHGNLKDGASLNGERVSGIFRMCGLETQKVGEARAGDIVALGRLESVNTGDTLSSQEPVMQLPKAMQLQPVYGLSIVAARRDDEVKMSAAVKRVLEEDPSLQMTRNQDTHETILWGQGEIHLQIAVDRMKNRSKIELNTSRPRVAYKEAIRKSVSQHARFKRQSGGHGQFGDVHINIKPLPRGAGFAFQDTVVGGSVPKQYIPAVGAGVKEYLRKGPLGFPVVDVEVTLTDGQYHAVDSSEQAFKTAGRMAMQEGLPKCDPVLLEPVYKIKIYSSSDATAKVNALISGRRGQILGFDSRKGWPGWDVVSAQMPESEMQDLIIELRSLSHGVGTFEFSFDHLNELQGKLADEVVQSFGSGSAKPA